MNQRKAKRLRREAARRATTASNIVRKYSHTAPWFQYADNTYVWWCNRLKERPTPGGRSKMHPSETRRRYRLRKLARDAFNRPLQPRKVT
jgi:hypothetical protein